MWLSIATIALAALTFAGCAATGGATSAGVPDGSQVMTSKDTGAGWAGTQPSLQEYVAYSDLPNIHFEFDKAVLSNESIAILNRHADWFKKHPGALVLIEGHADERGTNEYNLALGERRAKVAKNFLVSVGIHHSRMNQISFGKERPLCAESHESCWARNRRDQFLVKMR
jgi:peptidoglycan-associated lipoprotein